MTEAQIAAVLTRWFGNVEIRPPIPSANVPFEIVPCDDDSERRLVEFVDRTKLAHELGITDHDIEWSCVTEHVVNGHGMSKHMSPRLRLTIIPSDCAC